MKLTVLMDNNTYIDQYYLGEPAVSYYIEDGDVSLLMDCGYSDAFIRNAGAMNIDLSKLTHIVFSHGHDDHTGGLKFLQDKFDLSNVEIVAHPDCFYPREEDGTRFGAPYLAGEVADFAKLKLVTEPVWLTEHLLYLGQIADRFDFEVRKPIGQRQTEEGWKDDYCYDDSALVYRSNEGLFIITGCSHSGICNIIEQAKLLTGQTKIAGVLGGFHLFDVDDRLDTTIDYLQRCQIQDFYPCHCVSLKAKARMMEKLDVEEVGVGLKIEV
ncbi:MAG: MBL fold metallo-hydrolase [Firmicutes bacterium]|nr:MBL fold metallo-hydrolase [Bacillota bacterium]